MCARSLRYWLYSLSRNKDDLMTEIGWKWLSSGDEDETEEACKWTNEWGQVQEGTLENWKTEREVSIGRMSVPYHSVLWGWLSPPFLDNKLLLASFQPVLTKKKPGRWIHTALDTHRVELYMILQRGDELVYTKIWSFTPEASPCLLSVFGTFIWIPISHTQTDRILLIWF